LTSGGLAAPFSGASRDPSLVVLALGVTFKATGWMVEPGVEKKSNIVIHIPVIFIFILESQHQHTVLTKQFNLQQQYKMSKRFSCSPLIHSVKSVDARV
jgi:hypothetical protein